MKLFDVYPIFDIELVRAQGSYVWDKNGTKYLDLYGGHAVISIGHCHPYYVKKIRDQLTRIGFYSNAVKISLQIELSEKLGKISGYDNYYLFLCNSGAEAIENALKLASFYNNREKVIAFEKAFHGRTSGAVAITDNPKIQAPINYTGHVIRLPLNNEAALEKTLSRHDVCAVIIEGVQGVGGIYTPENSFLRKIKTLCEKYNTVLILDEVQSGYGRTGKFFAHQYADIQPDLIAVAKGMGNGFPIAGVLIHPKFEANYGMLGTTFGGNYLACTAAIAVLDVIEQENLINNAQVVGNYLIDNLKRINHGIKEIRGMGLMIAIEFDFPIKELRNTLLLEHHIFTGAASNKNTLRILPPLNLTQEDATRFLDVLKSLKLSEFSK
jgi:acetylornithine/N-succinyldiaminopimelate aminotransferase